MATIVLTGRSLGSIVVLFVLSVISSLALVSKIIPTLLSYHKLCKPLKNNQDLEEQVVMAGIVVEEKVAKINEMASLILSAT